MPCWEISEVFILKYEVLCKELLNCIAFSIECQYGRNGRIKI